MESLQYMGEDYSPNGRRWALGSAGRILFTFPSPWHLQNFMDIRRAFQAES